MSEPTPKARVQPKVRALTRPTLRWLALLPALAGCTRTACVEAAPHQLARAQPTPVAYTGALPDAGVTCPRVERAPRMYSGYAESVPQSQLAGHMHVVLDVIVPIQEALGRLFCADQRAPCKPAALLSIEVADIVASGARVTVQAAEGGERELLMQSPREGEWIADDESLALFLAGCTAQR